MNTTTHTVLITGASGGIGSELAKLMAADGNDLILIDKNVEGLGQITQYLTETFPSVRVIPIVKDLSTFDAAGEIYREVSDKQLQPDILVNNAGFGTLGYFVDTDWDRERQMMLLHVYTLTHLTKLFIKKMVKAGSGKILNVASVAGFVPSPLMAVYNASKAYVLSFSEALANEMQGTGVTVTVLCPGLTRTGFQEVVGAGNPNFIRSQVLSASPDIVAAYGYRAMLRGKVIAVPGLLNKFVTQAHRFLPRATAVMMVRKVQERNRRF